MDSTSFSYLELCLATLSKYDVKRHRHVCCHVLFRESSVVIAVACCCVTVIDDRYSVHILCSSSSGVVSGCVALGP